MEKNGRITLIDKELSEKQQSLSRYIEHYTRIPFSGQTYSEWQMWVEMNKPYADHLKAKENEQKAEEKPVKKYKNRDRKRGREIAVDCNNLYGAIKSIGETNSHICALCGFGHAYLSDVKRRGWMYESDITKLSDAGIDAADYVTDEWYRAKYLTEEEPAADVKEEQVEVVNFAGPLDAEMVFLAIDSEDMELLRVLSKAKSQHVADVCLGIIREQLDGIRLMIAEM